MNGPDDEAVQAAAWRLALDADARGERPLGAESWLAFTAWLEADPGRNMLLDAAEIQATPASVRRSRGGSRRYLSRRVWAAAVGALVAASVALAVVLSLPRPVTTTIVTTDASQAFVLADGTHGVLNRRGRIEARLGPHARTLRLATGAQAAFDVVHDAGRPFTVEIDGATVRVLGTRFDIDDGEGRLTVAVARGLVSVSDKGGVLAQVPAGRSLSRDANGATHLSPVAADAISGWTGGSLVYDNAPLPQVAADLSRYVGARVEVDRDAASLRFTGTLVVDKGLTMLGRLVTFMPIEASRTPTGVRLRSAPPRR